MVLFAFLPLWATLAVGAVAVAVPVVIHLLSRLRYRVVVWAAMRFLVTAQKQTTRRLRIEQLILLLVRAGIVGCIVLAMASVTGWAESLWQSIAPGAAGYGASRGGRAHLIIVLDGSLSMAAAEPGNKNCFEKAREVAARLIGDMENGDGVSILLMKDNPVWIVGEASQDPRKLLKELNAVRHPHGNSSVNATLSALAAKLREPGERFDVREVYFLTDLQQTSWMPDLAADGKTTDQDGGQSKVIQEIQKRARTFFVDVGREHFSNTAITLLSLGDPLVITNTDATFLVQAKNFSGQPRQRLNIKLSVGRWPVNSAEPEIRLAKTEIRELQAGEEQAVYFTHRFTAPGTYAVQVAIDDDDLGLDNSRTVIVTVKDTVPVLLVNGKPAVQRFDRAAEYLGMALNPFGPQVRTSLAPFRPTIVSMAQFSDANQANLAEYDCVFLCDVGQLSAAEVRRLEANVRRGAGLVITAGDNMAKHLEAYNRLLWKNDQGLLPAKLIGIQSAPPDHYFRLHAPDGFTQPPLREFLNEDGQISLQRARFQQYVRTQPANDAVIRKVLSYMPDILPGSKVTMDRALPVDDAAIIEWNPPARIDEALNPKAPKESGSIARGVSRLRGKVMLLTTSVNMDWNSWPASPSYLAMMQELTRFAVAGRLREQSVLVGGALEDFFAGTGELDGALWVPGEEKPRRVTTQGSDDLSIFRWLETDQSGIYRLTIGQDTQEYIFAVNVPTVIPDRKGSESDLARTDKNKLKAAYPNWDFQVVSDLKERALGGSGVATNDTDPEQLRKPKPLGPWIAHYLLVAVIVLLFAEIILACCFGHYSASAAALGMPASRFRRLPGWLGSSLAIVGLAVFAFLSVALIEYAFSGDFLGFIMPEGVRAWIEKLLDVPPPATGESSRWALRSGPVSSVVASAYPMLCVGVLGLAIVVIVLSSLFETRSGVRWLSLTGLGTLAFVNISIASSWLMLQPEIDFERQSWPDVVLLIDDSLSMGGVDPYRDEESRAPVTALAERYKRLVREKTPGQIKVLQERLDARREALAAAKKDVESDEDVIRHGRRIAGLQSQLAAVESTAFRPTRLQLAQAITLGSDPDWLATLSKKNRLKIHIFHLDASGRALKLTDAGGGAGDIIDPGDLDRAEKAVASLTPYGVDSRLGTAVRQIIDHYRGAQLSGIIMFTDGVTTVDESLVQVAEYAAQKGVPLFFVGIGEDREAREIELHDLQVEDPVFVNDRLIFEARLTGTGYKDLTIPIVLKEKVGNTEKELARELVKLDPSGKAVKVRLKHQPTVAGEKTYIVEAEIPRLILDELSGGGGERRLERTVFVQENKLIRVLYIEGSARYEYRYVKNLLERESADKKSNKTIDVRVLLVDSDEDYPRSDKTALAAFPSTKQELYQYDVVIIGDVDPRSVKLGEPRLRDLADFVKQRGGGLLAIAGAQYMPHAYRDTPLAAVLPIDIGKAAAEPEDRTEGYRLDPTLAGRLHPIFRFVTDEGENIALWGKLAPMYWWSESYRPKPLAEVLAVHPSAKSEGKAGINQDDRHPLVVQQYLGGGRSMFFGFDESWRWRFREDELRFNQFWIQTVRYLARSKLVRTELRLDRQSKYKVGEPIKVVVRFPDTSALQGGGPEPKPDAQTKVTVTVEHRPKEDAKGETEIQTLQLAKIEGSWATYEGIFTKTREGDYRFWLSHPDVSKQQPNSKKPSASAVVERPPGEDQLRFNQREMIQAAAAARSREELAALAAAGRKDPGYYTVATAHQILEDLSLDTVAATGQLVPYSPRPPWPVWNLFLFSFLPILMLLTAGWLLRKAVNLI